MGSFSWDNHSYLQYHNGRPLSVALTEPCDCELSPFIESDFAAQRHHARSNSSGRRFKRESYRIYHPNVQYTSYVCSPPLPRRQLVRSSSGDLLIEKLETVTIEEQQCLPIHTGISYVRTPSPPVRQVKIRSRPSSCYDLHNRESTDQRWTKVVDEHHEEHYNYNYNYNLPIDRIVPIQRDPTPPRFIHQNETVTTTEDFNFNITAKPAIRPSMRSVGTTTKDLRPLSRSETQVIERYEKDEKIRRDSLTESGTSILGCQRPLQHSYDGKTSKSYNALNVYSDHGRHDLTVRPTHKPREALVDTYEITAPPSNSSYSMIPITVEKNSRSRYYY
ncbi:unnamed protein product [Adineta steineri]|uniref:Uncharacterized protein n=1 Tax=Adineta steineri TaxID=433720 RepID=A0A814VMQ4_9BILA|nr:unnamed protein product [Adineta steineri]CAF1190142.1 unnamed protein product [Adineta steineri]CAF3713440.1 unnamed protein product [Adineta steineri]CAF3809959.1 unnamed protein product [Adineta steineri]